MDDGIKLHVGGTIDSGNLLLTESELERVCTLHKSAMYGVPSYTHANQRRRDGKTYTKREKR